VYVLFGSISINAQYLDNAIYFAFVSALLVTICSYFSLMRPIELLTEWNSNDYYQMKAFYLLNCVWHGILAGIFDSEMFAFVSIAMLMGFIGFSFVVGDLSIGFGFGERELIIPALISSLIVMVCGLILHFINNIFNIFCSPMLWLGSFVCFTATSIVSSLYYQYERYSYNNRVNYSIYTITQIGVVSLHLVTLFVGNVYNIHELYTMSGIFGVFYLLQKFIEIMPKSYAAFAWCGLIICSLMCASNYFMLRSVNM
jgi:hypothetical protein